MYESVTIHMFSSSEEGIKSSLVSHDEALVPKPVKPINENDVSSHK